MDKAFDRIHNMVQKNDIVVVAGKTRYESTVPDMHIGVIKQIWPCKSTGKAMVTIAFDDADHLCNTKNVDTNNKIVGTKKKQSPPRQVVNPNSLETKLDWSQSKIIGKRTYSCLSTKTLRIGNIGNLLGAA